MNEWESGMRSEWSQVSQPIRWFRYVCHGDRAEYEALGWQFDSELGHHGTHSVLMIWSKDGDPTAPKVEAVE